jgi:hypothetical protein
MARDGKSPGGGDAQTLNPALGKGKAREAETPET